MTRNLAKHGEIVVKFQQLHRAPVFNLQLLMTRNKHGEIVVKFQELRFQDLWARNLVRGLHPATQVS